MGRQYKGLNHDIPEYADTIDAYINCKRPFHKSEIIRLKDIRPDDYLEEFPKDIVDDPVCIYRSSLSMDLSDVRKEISWTIDIDTAVLFYWRYLHAGFQDIHLYNGLIERENMIAYTNRLGEFEVIQYDGVENIREIPVELAVVEKTAFKLLGRQKYETALKKYHMERRTP